MFNQLPKPNPSSPPMTHGQRRTWLALQEQKRRRHRATPAEPPVTPSFTIALAGNTLAITQVGPDAYSAIGIQYSADGETGWEVVGDLQFGTVIAGTSGWDPGYYRICWEDENGLGQAPFSNVVQLVPGIVIALDGSLLSISYTGPVSEFGYALEFSEDGNNWSGYDGWNDQSVINYDLTGATRGIYRVAATDGDGYGTDPISNAVDYEG